MKQISTVTLVAILLLALSGIAKADPPVAVQAAEPDGPASAELRGMVKTDQQDRDWFLKGRKMTPAEEKRMNTRDAKRLARVRQLLKADRVRTAKDFDNASLLFQHGRTPDDIQVAHELGIITLLQAKGRSLNNMLVLAEDRFLDYIGRKQRFGSQGRPVSPVAAKTPLPASQIKDVDEEGDLAVTDNLRADLFMPPLVASKEKGSMALNDHLDTIIARLQQRYNTEWQTEQAQRPVSQELEQLAKSAPSPATTSRVLELYRADDLRTPDDYYYAAKLLYTAAPLLPTSTRDDKETVTRQYLLAHELATVAALRKKQEARHLFAKTWDACLLSLDRPQRYGTQPGAGKPIATRTVLRLLDVTP